MKDVAPVFPHVIYQSALINFIGVQLNFVFYQAVLFNNQY